MNSLMVFGILAAIATITTALPEGRIANGWNALRGAAPYIVSLQKKSGGAYPHFCGGAILDEHWILTAAHCLHPEDIEADNVVIKAGRFNLKTYEPAGQERSIDYYKAHELYIDGPNPYDIALLYTKEPFLWTNSVQPIALPEKDSIPTGNANLYGWGLTWNVQNEIRFPEVLQTARMPVLSIEECRRRMGRTIVDETNICTGSLQKGITACSSDSGGPLAQKNSKHEDVIIGVVSWGLAECGQANKASVFGRVSAFIDWINKTKEEFYNLTQ